MATFARRAFSANKVAGGGGSYTGPTLIGSAVKTAGSGATSIAIAQADFDVAPSNGDKVIIIGFFHYDAKNGALSQAFGTQHVLNGAVSGQSFVHGVWAHTAASDGTYTATVTFPGTMGHAMVALALRGGVAPPPALDVNGGVFDPANTSTFKITPAVNNTFVLCNISADSTGLAPTIPTPTGFTSIRAATVGTTLAVNVFYQTQQTAALIDAHVNYGGQLNNKEGSLLSWK